jgi:hypothetical protein
MTCIMSYLIGRMKSDEQLGALAGNVPVIVDQQFQYQLIVCWRTAAGICD